MMQWPGKFFIPEENLALTCSGVKAKFDPAPMALEPQAWMV